MKGQYKNLISFFNPKDKRRSVYLSSSCCVMYDVLNTSYYEEYGENVNVIAI